MSMYKIAVVGVCLTIHICAEEVIKQSKDPCDARGEQDCESTRGVSALQITLSNTKGENVPEESDEEDIEIKHIQTGITEKPSNDPLLYKKLIGDPVLPGETKMGPHFRALEQWQDLTKYELFDANAMAAGTLTVSQQDWLQSFSKLDVNKDGKIDASDLAAKEVQCSSHHLNATQENYRQAVGMMTEYAPEFKDFIIAHEPAAIFLAEMNKSAPKDAPVPSNETMGLFQNNLKTVALTESEWTPCFNSLARFVYQTVGWGLNMMGIYIMGKFDGAGPLWIFERIKQGYQEWFTREATYIWENIKKWHFWQAAKGVWNVLKKTFSLGMIGDLIRNALSKMSWWEWLTSGISFLARMIAQMVTAGGALIAHMFHQIVHAYMLVQKGKQVCIACALNCGGGGWTVGQLRWATHPSKCMDVAGGHTVDGTNLQMYDCDHGTADNMKFTIPKSRSGQIHWATNPYKCLDVSAGGTWNGNNIVTWECVDNNPNQQFIVPPSGTGRIQWAPHPNKCIDVAAGHGGTGNGVNVQLWDCNNDPNQQWQIP